MTSLTGTIAEIIETCIKVHGDFDTWWKDRWKGNEASLTFVNLINLLVSLISWAVAFCVNV